ncbi:hypothetical protein M948_18295 [Virgibacillus sp. CM-4]|uniref:hypothetical protein n=1 Tax=Virgibacillus sp. CM-4 TaxID=1354277 RepID=UPI0003888F2C|nr:hypothetical protein [Virgibacillus sp. CM-4]EQB35051.1 hypothetical protein M948_18295 [Virgibacillus sp. CM-4]
MEYIQTYNTNVNGNKMKVFFVLDENGGAKSVKVGNQVVPSEEGIQFYVDKHVALQIDKCDLIIESRPYLKVKDGETIEIPDEVQQKEERIKELEKELEELRGNQ